VVSAFGGSMESGDRRFGFVSAFITSLASVVVNMFSHLIY
jgi:hypothetical protein